MGISMVMPDDVVVAVSNSGETDEILKPRPHFKHYGLKPIVTGNPNRHCQSGRSCSRCSRQRRARPLVGATTSTTVAWPWAMPRGSSAGAERLTEADFAMRHPGGMLGRKLLLRVEDLMYRGERLPLVQEMTTVKDALFDITAKRLGVTGVVNEKQELVGVLTDGDLRRGLESKGQILSLPAQDLMTRNPKTIPAETLASEAVAVMKSFRLLRCLCLSMGPRTGRYVHLHDLIKAGLTRAEDLPTSVRKKAANIRLFIDVDGAHRRAHYHRRPRGRNQALSCP
jgi:arabinose-5-phosphate isomerase